MAVIKNATMTGGAGDYFMESDQEAVRLDIKTRPDAIRNAARFSGVASGMRVADLGCGAGITTRVLSECVGRDGAVFGVDISTDRIAYAKERYAADNIRYLQGDIREPIIDIGTVDLVWIRFVLEYHRTRMGEIVQNAYEILAPGGTLCLMDLDYNCLSHFGLSSRLENNLRRVVEALETERDFDPYAGRKLYAILYDLGVEQIAVEMEAHHLFYGDIPDSDLFNWTMKVKAARPFFDSEAEYTAFFDEFSAFIKDPRRFTYTPLIMCKGKKPTDRP